MTKFIMSGAAIVLSITGFNGTVYAANDLSKKYLLVTIEDKVSGAPEAQEALDKLYKKK